MAERSIGIYMEDDVTRKFWPKIICALDLKIPGAKKNPAG